MMSFRAHALLVAKSAELFDEVAHGEVGRVALRLVPELLAEAQRLDVRALHRPGVVTDPFQRGGDELVVGHREPAVQNRRGRPLL